MENWVRIPPFPGYSVSDHGYVRNDVTARVLSRLVNNRGSVYVGLVKDGEQYNRTVARLVTDAFLPKPTLKAFDTPINLDGDRTHLEVTNLVLRPRWFAVKYRQQFKVQWSEDNPVVDIESGVKYTNSMHAATSCGLLALNVFEWALSYDYYMLKKVEGVWPTDQRFRFVHIIPRQSRGL